MYKLYFYVPEENLTEVKTHLFQAGAGQIGDYEKCAWQTKGIGQFKPGQDSNPHIGNQGEVEQLEEYKVEMVIQEPQAESLIETLIKVHPYEEPAYGLIKIYTQDNL